MNGHRHANFSLVEMVLVLVVIALLVTMITPAFEKALSATRVDTAAAIVGSELRHARMQAINSRKFVAVLMPTTQDEGKGGVADEAYKASAIRTCLLTGAPAFNGTSQNWVGTFAEYASSSKWSFLPAGTYVGYTDTHGTWASLAASCSCNTVDGVRFPHNYSSSSINNLRAIMFKPDGSAVSAPQGTVPGTVNTTVKVMEGVIRSGNQLWPRGSNSVTMIVQGFIGRIRYRK